MANRRMVSNGIVKSARFLKMPPTTQNLYFHLIMNADDDGVVEAFPIMRMVGATEDDLKILMDKVFVYILNDDLVAYVNNWTEHNKVRLERKVDSLYKELLLRVVPDIDYREPKRKVPKANDRQMTDKCQTDGRQMSAEDRLGKDRLGKDSIGHYSSEKKKQSDDNEFSDLRPIYAYYENNGFGSITTKTRTDFQYWVDDFVKTGVNETDAIELIIYALGKAIDNNVRKYSYVNSILKDYENKRYRSVDQIKADEQKIASNNSKYADTSNWKVAEEDF